MPGLRNVNARAVVDFLKANGFSEHRQKGSHLIFISSDGKRLAIVPMHGTKSIPIGTLLSILRMSGLTRDALEAFLERQ